MNSSRPKTGLSVLKIILGFVFGFLVLMLSSVLIVLSGVSDLMHMGMFAFSFVLILVLSKGKISEYGFKVSGDLKLKNTVLVGLIAGFIITSSTLVLPIHPPPGVEDFSFFELVIFIWILASVGEEVLTRGLIQSYLSPLRGFGFSILGFPISLPVLAGALFFGGMHLGLLSMGLDSFSVWAIVISAFFMGIIAGYYREKTESIIPAIIIHILFNICGTIIGAIKELI
ncbi:MAG: hypothetical protein AMJ90_02520 [candidate division Zixibacteria bacterium SM23_73_2]|nr:MAG: hypothetical protein AMJ90_02520 [candidate division Zixibacteria bacterium SM23_73_2]